MLVNVFDLRKELDRLLSTTMFNALSLRNLLHCESIGGRYLSALMPNTKTILFSRLFASS